MRIAICEDTYSHAELLKASIEHWANTKSTHVSIDLFPSGEAFLIKWPDTRQFDLVFIDIQMKLLDGYELSHIIRKHDENMMIVFVTAFLDYALRGYDVQALKYLVKPIKNTDCWKVMDRAFDLHNKKKDNFLILSIEAQVMRVPLDDIFYIDVHSHYVDIHTKRSTITYKEKLRNLEARLPSPHFFQCHRSCIVNVAHVTFINYTEAHLDNGMVVPVARARYDDLHKAFQQYFL